MEAHEVMDLLDDDEIEIVGEINVTDDIVLLNYKYINDEDAKQNNNTSVAVGAFVTSYARCYLYETLAKLQAQRHDSVKYCDTGNALS